MRLYFTLFSSRSYNCAFGWQFFCFVIFEWSSKHFNANGLAQRCDTETHRLKNHNIRGFFMLRPCLITLHTVKTKIHHESNNCILYVVYKFIITNFIYYLCSNNVHIFVLKFLNQYLRRREKKFENVVEFIGWKCRRFTFSGIINIYTCIV